MLQQRNAPARDPALSQQGDAFEAHADSVAAAVVDGDGAASAGISRGPAGQPSGAAPAVQRQESSAAMGPEAVEEVDEMVAAIYNVFYNDPTTTDTLVLIAQAGMLFDVLVDILEKDAVAAAKSAQAKRYRPLVRIAATQALLHIGQELARREARAARAPDGALLTDQFAETVPWTPQRARKLSEVTSPGGKPIFTDANMQMWTIAMLKTPNVLLAPAGKRGSSSATRPKAPAAKVEARKPDPAAAAAPTRAMMLGADAQAQEKTATEEDAPAMIGPEVATGLARLRGATIGDALEAIRKRMTEVSQPGEQPAKVFPTATDKLSLLQVCGRVIFLGNRIYRLDRTGHIAAGDFAILPKWMSFRKGGVYFFAPFRVGTEGSKSSMSAPMMVRVDSNPMVAEGGDFMPMLVNEGFAPLFTDLQGIIRNGGGIAVMVSSRYGHEELGFSDIDTAKVRRAIIGAEGHLPWAIRSRLRQAEENPGGEVFNAALGLGISELVSILPPIRAPLAMYHALREVEWIADHINMAGFARTEDEVNFASQSIARKLADEVVDRIIGGVVSAGAGGIKSGVGKVRARGASGADAGTSKPQPRQAPAAGESAPPPVPQAPKRVDAAGDDNRPNAKVIPLPVKPRTPPKPAQVDDRPDAKVIPLPAKPRTPPRPAPGC